MTHRLAPLPPDYAFERRPHLTVPLIDADNDISGTFTFALTSRTTATTPIPAWVTRNARLGDGFAFTSSSGETVESLNRPPRAPRGC
ncbi:MAG: hypothetical protein ACI8TP_001384 [Acidimicrobiales bacterium]|jgi:hypothetical protein